MRTILFATTTLLASTQLIFSAEPVPWKALPLINDGKIDPAWTQLWGGSFEVLEKEGAIRTKCDDRGMGLLLYTKEKFGNCQIQVVFRPQNEKSNSGVYVRIGDDVLKHKNDPLPKRERDSTGKLTAESLKRLEQSSNDEKEAWYPVHHGYEVQICDAGDGMHRTGAVYSLAPAAEAPRKAPGEWRTMIITLNGNQITVSVDGQQVTSFDSSSPNVPERKIWYEPKRESPRPQTGYIGLQAHDPGDVVDFKEIKVRSRLE